MASDNFVFSSNVINQARFSINRISANPAVTQRFEPAGFRHQPDGNTKPRRRGTAVVPGAGLLRRRHRRARRSQQPFVDRINHVWQFADDLTRIRAATR